MWENILVATIVALVAVALGRRLYRTATGSSGSDHCGGNEGCRTHGCCATTLESKSKKKPGR